MVLKKITETIQGIAVNSIPEGRKAEEVTDAILYDKDIFITPGTIFGSQGEGYIRFSLCVTAAIIKEAISRI